MGLFLFLTVESTSVVLHVQLSAERIDEKHKRLKSCKIKKIHTYPQVVNSLLQKYSNNEVITETEFKIGRFEKSSDLEPSQYAEELATKALYC